MVYSEQKALIKQIEVQIEQGLQQSSPLQTLPHQAMFSAYQKLLQKYPLPTRMLTNGIICCFADSFTQNFIDKNQKFNFRRNLNLFLVGMLYSAPMLHFWYSRVVPVVQRRLFTENTPKFRRVLTLVLVDQILLAPVMLTGFFVMNGVVNAPLVDGFKSGVDNWKCKFLQAFQRNWTIWPAAVFFNFWFIPQAFRVLFSNMVGFFWNIYLSHLAYDKKNGMHSQKIR